MSETKTMNRLTFSVVIDTSDVDLSDIAALERDLGSLVLQSIAFDDADELGADVKLLGCVDI